MFIGFVTEWGGADFVQNFIPMSEVWTNIVTEGGADFVQNLIPMPEVWTNIVAEGEADFVRRKIVG